MASLEAGFSHDIFVEWATDAKNLVLFSERGQVYSRLHSINPLKVFLTYFFLLSSDAEDVTSENY